MEHGAHPTLDLEGDRAVGGAHENGLIHQRAEVAGEEPFGPPDAHDRQQDEGEDGRVDDPERGEPIEGFPGPRFRCVTEIQSWIDDHEVESFVILDDSSDMAHLMPKLVHTSMETGLTEDHVEQALSLLAGIPLQAHDTAELVGDLRHAGGEEAQHDAQANTPADLINRP